MLVLVGVLRCSVTQEGDSSGDVCYVTLLVPFAAADLHK